ncbi:MAG: hypothetical protein GTO40_18410 [Deltaproteobacteria bacterium]|nr:hypothetical protein [Deltaproteobacteria bacterium]
MPEVLLAALFGAILISTLYVFYRDQLYRLLIQETQTATLEDTRGALDTILREIRNAGSFTVPTDATCAKDAFGLPLRVVASDGNSIQIQSDIDEDGACVSTGENVTYNLFPETASCSVIRRNSVALVGYCSGTSPATDVSIVTPAGSLFTYFNGLDVPLDPSDATFDPSNIKRVRITFSVQEPNPDPRQGGSVASTLSSSVAFRN